MPADTPKLPTCCSRGKPVRNAEGQLNVHVGDHCRYRLCGLASLDQRITSGQSARSWPVGVTQPKVPDKARQRQPEERRPPGPQGLQNLQDPRGSKWPQRAIEERPGVERSCASRDHRRRLALEISGGVRCDDINVVRHYDGLALARGTGCKGLGVAVSLAGPPRGCNL